MSPPQPRRVQYGSPYGNLAGVGRGVRTRGPAPPPGLGGPDPFTPRRPYERPYQPGMADGWTDGESAAERRSKTVVNFLPRDYVARAIESKEQEIAVLQSCVSWDALHHDPSTANWYLTTDGEFQQTLREMEARRRAELGAAPNFAASAADYSSPARMDVSQPPPKDPPVD